MECASQKRFVSFHDEVVFDDGGRRVIVNRLLDEGDFRSVYVARDARSTKKLYALKKVDCRNDKEGEDCRMEVAIHRLICHQNVMPLLAVKFVQNPAYCTCFMLFPYMNHSMENEITARRLREDRPEKQRRPFSPRQVLLLLEGITKGLEAIHKAGFSHRDIRVENILLQKGERRGDVGIPVLTDFGSAGELSVTLSSWDDFTKAKEDVRRLTTAAYRAPELWELQYTPGQKALDYGCADMWSLGCLIFASCYGLSPFEMEWRISLVEADGTVQYVGTSYEQVMGPIPFPPGGGAADRYDEDITGMISWMLSKQCEDRPSTSDVLEAVQSMLNRKNNNH